MDKVEIKFKDENYIRFQVGECEVYSMDNNWLCQCRIKSNKNFKKSCEHVRKCKKHLNTIKNNNKLRGANS